MLDAAGDPGFAGGGEHVDFTAHAKFGQVDAGLDGEAGVGQDAALVVSFKIVEVRAGTVNLVRDVVAGAMGEEVAKAGGANDGAGCIIGLEAANCSVPDAKACRTAAMAASRAWRTVEKMICSFFEGSRPMTPVQVMS